MSIQSFSNVNSNPEETTLVVERGRLINEFLSLFRRLFPEETDELQEDIIKKFDSYIKRLSQVSENKNSQVPPENRMSLLEELFEIKFPSEFFPPEFLSTSVFIKGLFKHDIGNIMHSISYNNRNYIKTQNLMNLRRTVLGLKSLIKVFNALFNKDIDNLFGIAETLPIISEITFRHDTEDNTRIYSLIKVFDLSMDKDKDIELNIFCNQMIGLLREHYLFIPILLTIRTLLENAFRLKKVDRIALGFTSDLNSQGDLLFRIQITDDGEAFENVQEVLDGAKEISLSNNFDNIEPERGLTLASIITYKLGGEVKVKLSEDSKTFTFMIPLENHTRNLIEG